MAEQEVGKLDFITEALAAHGLLELARKRDSGEMLQIPETRLALERAFRSWRVAQKAKGRAGK